MSFVVDFLGSPLSVQWSVTARGSDGDRKHNLNWDYSAEDVYAQPQENKAGEQI